MCDNVCVRVMLTWQLWSRPWWPACPHYRSRLNVRRGWSLRTQPTWRRRKEDNLISYAMLIQSDAYGWLFVLLINNIVSLLKVFVQEILSNVLFLSLIKLLSQHAHYSLLIIWMNESWCNQNKQLKKKLPLLSNVLKRHFSTSQTFPAVIYLRSHVVLCSVNKPCACAAKQCTWLLFGVVEKTAKICLWLIAADFCLHWCLFHICGEAWGCNLTVNIY